MLGSLLVLVFASSVCPFMPPAEGRVVRSYAPDGSYGGHWGVDVSAPRGTAVRAAAPGHVTFAGRLAGRMSVTIAHGGGVRTSYSYLASVRVAVGESVSRGEVIGESGVDHGVEAVHFSLRIGTTYVEPPLGDCRLVPAAGLRLDRISAATTYPLSRATRHSRRHVRPASSGPPHRGRGSPSRDGARRRHVHAGRVALAEGAP